MNKLSYQTTTNMGIPHYFHTIAQTYSGILHFTRPRACRHFFMDYNGAIHHAVKEYLKDATSPDERDMMKAVWDYTTACVATVQPDIVGLYVDGVAPVAKIQQQRKRRYLSIFRQRLEGKKTAWDTNAISPGTSFMHRLQAFLRQVIREDVRGHTYHLSAADEVGEGEHKIFAKLSGIPRDETVFIHGLDADLIMLSLLSHRPNLYLMREPSYPYEGEGFLYLDVHMLREGLLQYLRDSMKWSITYDDPYDARAISYIETYVVLCFLLGNDFIPHGIALSLKRDGHTTLLQAGKLALDAYPSGAVHENKVCMQFIAHVLMTLKKGEDQALWEENKRMLMKKPSPYKDEAENYPVLHKHKMYQEVMSLPKVQSWRPLYYKHLFFAKKNDTRVIANACRSYIEGIAWTYRYYKRLPRDSYWYYPYGYAPTLLDVSNYLEGSMHEWDTIQNEWQHKPIEWLDPLVQLCCILPKESHHLIPDKYTQLLNDASHGIAYLFPDKYSIQTYMHTYLWECNPILPPLDIPWISSCVEDYKKHV